MKQYRPDRPTKRAILAHHNAQRPLDAPPIEWERKRHRKFQEDEIPDGLGGTDDGKTTD